METPQSNRTTVKRLWLTAFVVGWFILLDGCIFTGPLLGLVTGSPLVASVASAALATGLAWTLSHYALRVGAPTSIWIPVALASVPTLGFLLFIVAEVALTMGDLTVASVPFSDIASTPVVLVVLLSLSAFCPPLAVYFETRRFEGAAMSDSSALRPNTGQATRHIAQGPTT